MAFKCVKSKQMTATKAVSQYHSFLTTESARQTIPHFYHDLQFSQQWVDGNTSDPDSEHDDDYHDQEQEQWMQLFQLNPQFITPQTTLLITMAQAVSHSKCAHSKP